MKTKVLIAAAASLLLGCMASRSADLRSGKLHVTQSWTQEKKPLVMPIAGEKNDLYGPSLFRWQGRNYVVYQDHSGNRGGLVKYVELDDQLNPVGTGGQRHVLIEHDPDSPADNRYRGCEFYREDDTIYMYCGVANHPRVIAYATAKVGSDR